MVTGNMLVMFIVGFIIFCFYLFGLLYSIYWGHNSQRREMENDPELRDYYSRHGQGDLMDYDGMGNYGRFPNTEMPSPKRRKKKSTKTKTKTKTTV